MPLTSLVVCADAKAVQVLSEIFRDLEISVEHCGQVSSMPTGLSTQHFDAMVMDCADPEALEFVAAARRTPLNKNSVIVCLVEEREQVPEAFGHGANFILYKPVTVERAGSSLRAARGLMRREQRSKLRVALHAPATIAYAGAENVPATLLDLSESGLSIQAQRRLPSHCKVYFHFNLPGEKSPVRLSGDVVWQDASGRVGVRFVDVPQTSRRALSDWVKKSLAQMAEVERRQAPAAAQTGPESQNRAKSARLLSSSNRRGDSRHACRLGADVYRVNGDVPYRCSLSDLSTGGCYVETTEPFASGTHVEIVVRTLQLKLRVRGTVQTVHPGFGMGVRFSIQTAHEREQVQQLIACQPSEPGITV
jgi:CheY-like chemotaxis protein